MKSYFLSLVTPEGIAFEGNVTSIIVPGSEGSFGVLAHHTPMTALLKQGVVQIKFEGKEKYFATASGILEINHRNECLILANHAKECDSLEKAKAVI